MNLCPCGYFGDDRQQCTCSLSAVQRYQQRISGPLLDRIDIHLDMVRVPFQKLASLWKQARIQPRSARVWKRHAGCRSNAVSSGGVLAWWSTATERRHSQYAATAQHRNQQTRRPADVLQMLDCMGSASRCVEGSSFYKAISTIARSAAMTPTACGRLSRSPSTAQANRTVVPG